MHVDELNGLQSDLIRIETFSNVATYWLPNIIKKFQHDYTNIDYELLLGDYKKIEEWILEGRVDYGFLHLSANAELETIFLKQDRLLDILPENHPLSKKEYCTVADLCHNPFMLLENGEKSDIIDNLILKKLLHQKECNSFVITYFL